MSSINININMNINPTAKPSTLRPFHSGKLSGEQATFMCGITNLICVLVLNLAYPEGSWAPHKVGWWLSLAAGVVNAASTFFLYKAYETAPSTVIVPLAQLTAVMMLIASTAVSLIAPIFPDILASEVGNFISFKEAIAYTIILVGGLYPATKGNIQMFLEPRFWKQPFVYYILLNDILLAVLYEIIEVATSENLGITAEQYTIVSTYSNVFSFMAVYFSVPRLRAEVRTLRHCHRRHMVVCFAAEMLNWVAFFVATYGYTSHAANVNVINVAEVALNQIMNLVTAVFMLKFLRMGRDDAVSNLSAKVLSCVLVTTGIVLATFDISALLHGGSGIPPPPSHHHHGGGGGSIGGTTEYALTPTMITDGSVTTDPLSLIPSICMDEERLQKLGHAAFRRVMHMCSKKIHALPIDLQLALGLAPYNITAAVTASAAAIAKLRLNGTGR